VGRFSLSSNEILLDSTEAVQSFLGPYWRRKIFCKGSVARFIEPLHLKWLPAKRQLRIKFNYATYNDQGELQTDGRQYLLWEGPYRHWPPSPPLPLLPVVEQGGCAGAASLSDIQDLYIYKSMGGNLFLCPGTLGALCCHS